MQRTLAIKAEPGAAHQRHDLNPIARPFDALLRMAGDASRLVSVSGNACVCVGRCIGRHLAGPVRPLLQYKEHGCCTGLMRFTSKDCTRSSLKGRYGALTKCRRAILCLGAFTPCARSPYGWKR